MIAVARRLPVAPVPEPTRPVTRGDCCDVPRPCPFVACRYNLFLEVGRTGALRLNHTTLGPRGQLVMPWVANDPSPHDVPAEESCALDIAEDGPHEQTEVARLLGGVTVEWIRQTERAGEAEMRVRGGVELREVLVDYAPDPMLEQASPGLGGVTRALGDVLAEAGGWVSLEDPAEREARELAEWTHRVMVLVRCGLSLRRAWAAANDALRGGREGDEAQGQDREGLDEVTCVKSRTCPTPPPSTVGGAA